MNVGFVIVTYHLVGDVLNRIEYTAVWYAEVY